ncbi:hypothetical protein [Nitratiruptor tergarcus]|uniref:Uncharacterized protein n=1 Tax=Nitratiruptor tergarcus DSM 16512 TaxID=1069081 RepID=A0A1W1WUW9_9BACT|nr:hypothetical protein [Nitratiruptor tergarcus]SMC09979.1 hypothetical protein SAMN05660197_1805 [Nitratiruptor tergarcus DSM 16512]
MAFFYFILFLLLIFAIIGAVIYFFTELTSRIKYFILAGLLVGWAAIFAYSYFQNKKRIERDKIYYEYLHDKYITCIDPFGKKVIVNKQNFNFVSGTLVFMGKEGSRYEGLVISIDKCKGE